MFRSGVFHSLFEASYSVVERTPLDAYITPSTSPNHSAHYYSLSPLCFRTMFVLPQCPMPAAHSPVPSLRRRDADSTFLAPPIAPIPRLPSLPVPALPPVQIASAGSCGPTSPVSPATPMPSKIVPVNHAETTPASTSTLTPFWPRPRGDDGRFVPTRSGKGKYLPAPPKTCGWCLTHETSQWRLGSVCAGTESPMRVLCNACGINFRRATAKRSQGEGPIDLDALARAMGPARPSIQKALKRAKRSRVIGGARMPRGSILTKKSPPRYAFEVKNPPAAVSSSNKEVSTDCASAFAQVGEAQGLALPSIRMLLKSIGEEEIPLFRSAFSIEERTSASVFRLP